MCLHVLLVRHEGAVGREAASHEVGAVVERGHGASLTLNLETVEHRGVNSHRGDFSFPIGVVKG